MLSLTTAKTTALRQYLIYVVKLFAAFTSVYAIILLVKAPIDPYNFYVPWLDHHLNPFNWMARALLYPCKGILALLGQGSYFDGPITLRLNDGRGVEMQFGCLGLMIISFWIGFVYANGGGLKKMLKWVLIGVVSICIINIFRVTNLLLSIKLGWKPLFGLDHHDLFTYMSYVAIMALMFFYGRKQNT